MLSFGILPFEDGTIFDPFFSVRSVFEDNKNLFSKFEEEKDGKWTYNVMLDDEKDDVSYYMKNGYLNVNVKHLDGDGNVSVQRYGRSIPEGYEIDSAKVFKDGCKISFRFNKTVEKKSGKSIDIN